MTFFIVLAATCAVVFLAQPALRRAPLVFYAICVALDVVIVALTAGVLPSDFVPAASLLLRRGFVALSLFVIVMYTGVFPYGSAVRNRLAPIRAVLAIGACILALGHISAYFGALMPKLFKGILDSTTAAAMVAGLCLLALLLVLGATSFRFVRKRMHGKTWLKVQKWAYAFYALIYAHSVLLLLPSALKGGDAAQVSVIAYSFVFGIYAVARIARAVQDRKAAERAAEKRAQEIQNQSVGV